MTNARNAVKKDQLLKSKLLNVSFVFTPPLMQPQSFVSNKPLYSQSGVLQIGFERFPTVVAFALGFEGRTIEQEGSGRAKLGTVPSLLSPFCSFSWTRRVSEETNIYIFDTILCRCSGIFARAPSVNKERFQWPLLRLSLQSSLSFTAACLWVNTMEKDP